MHYHTLQLFLRNMWIILKLNSYPIWMIYFVLWTCFAVAQVQIMLANYWIGGSSTNEKEILKQQKHNTNHGKTMAFWNKFFKFKLKLVIIWLILIRSHLSLNQKCYFSLWLLSWAYLFCFTQCASPKLKWTLFYCRKWGNSSSRTQQPKYDSCI